jgi:hypothetical protein
MNIQSLQMILTELVNQTQASVTASENQYTWSAGHEKGRLSAYRFALDQLAKVAQTEAK